MKEAQNVIKAWDKLKGDKNYSVSVIQAWIVEDLTPAIKELRKVLESKTLDNDN